MGSKKHKKESKKKKHRSRSRSPIDGEERERKRHHKKHKDRKKERSPDVEEVPVDSHLAEAGGSRSRSRSAERDRRMREERRREKSREKEPSPAAVASSNQESLSVEETNRLRAKLGLKPLEVADKPTDDGKFKDDLGEFYHKPAANISQQKKTDKIKEKLEERREKRKIEQKLQTRLLGEESDGEDDAVAWVKKSREIEKQKKEAARRAAMLDEMDAVFGVSELVEAESRDARSYAPRDVRGLRVAHDFNQFNDEQSVILTLADQPVLADKPEDVLVNVNMLDDERYKKNQEEKKKARTGYQAYDDEEDIEAAALGYKKPVLSKYDDEIDKEQAEQAKGFVIGDDDAIEAKKFKEMMRRARLEGDMARRLESLVTPALQVASEYMDDHEVEAKFKKFKKKNKKGLRKKAKAEPIDVDDYDPNTAPLETDDTEVKAEQLRSMKTEMEEDEVEVDSELQAALARARRLKQADTLAAHKAEKIAELVKNMKEEEPEGLETGSGGGMVVDATAEFCRALGHVPSYGAAPNRDHTELMDMEEEEDDIEPPGPNGEAEARAGAGGGGAGAGGAWSRVDLRSEPPPDVSAGCSVALDAEPALDGGVAGALRLALSKGYLEKTNANAAPRAQTAHLAQLAARHYSIEDKTHGEDDKHSRRERGGYSGPLSDFREKSNFRPNIKLEYVDDEGRPLCPKEAFRYLSHKFHGKGPGKNKQEKRIKKQVQEGLMKKMSSTDTPLNTLSLLQEKQKETHSPFIVLSGLKKETNN